MAKTTEGLSKTQQERFVGLTERITKKIEQTFGQTAEETKLTDPHFNSPLGENEDGFRALTITSRGMEFRVEFRATKV